MMDDIRYAGRLIKRQPAFALLMVITLALGIGAASAVFTICDRVLLRPLPYPSPERIVALDKVSYAFSPRGMAIPRDLMELRELEAVGMYATGGLNLGDGAGAVRLRAAAATSGFFKALGVGAAMGRVFDPAEDRDAARVAVLSAETWRRHFEQDLAILGREIRLNSQSFRVIGVMPSGFTFPSEAGVWIPPGSDRQISGPAFGPSMLARIAPGVSIAQVTDAIARFMAGRRKVDALPREEWPLVRPLRDRLVGGARPTLVFLAGVVGLLLAATCANVAGLLLARLRVRGRELLVRSALGASRGRLVRQLLIECFVLTGPAAALGLLGSIATVRLFAASVPTFAPDVDLTTPDARFFVVGVAVSLVTAVVFAFGPALLASRKPASEILREGATPRRRARWLGQVLVVSQVAVALVLLAATSAALAVVVRLARIDLGFTNERAVVFELTLPNSRYGTAAAKVDFLDRLETRLRSSPLVVAAGTTDYVPGSTHMGIGVGLQLAGHEPPRGERLIASLLSATPDYFRTMGIPIRAGRSFLPTDRTGTAPVAIVSEAAARALEPGGNVVGQRLLLNFGRAPTEIEIVGVSASVRNRAVIGDAPRQIYRPVGQGVMGGSAGVAVDLAAGSDASGLAFARTVVHEIDPELPLYNVTRVKDLRARFLATERLTLAMTAIFGGLALALSAIGLFGVLSQLVAQRTREIGIRMALGANRGRLRASVVGTGLRLAGAGVVVGAAASALAWRGLTHVVPTLAAASWTSLGLDAIVLLAVAALAAWVPARRASSIDPMHALRTE